MISSPTTTLEALQLVHAVLRVYRYDASAEAVLQEGIERALRDGSVGAEREVVLSPGNRIDFLAAGGIGIEVKVDGGRNEVLRQLLRYAEHDSIQALVLFTTRSRHLSMPDVLRGKPLRVLFQGGV